MRKCVRREGEPLCNLLSDPALTERFQEEALRITKSLKYKYYNVFDQMSEDDVVSECWIKIISQNISFDESKNCKFESFVRMIVTSKLIDLTRSINISSRIPVWQSLEDTPFSGQSDSDAEKITRYDIIKDERIEEEVKYRDTLDTIMSMAETLNNFPVKEMVELYAQGFSADIISEKLNVPYYRVLDGIQILKRIFKDSNSTEEDESIKSIWEVLRDFERLPEKEQQLFLYRATYIVDTKTGKKLSDIARMILKGESYSSISKKFNCDRQDIIDFMERHYDKVI